MRQQKNIFFGVFMLVVGALSALGFAPYGIIWLLILCLAIFIRILAVSSWLQGAGWGFLFGIGHFYLGFIWLLTSLHDYGGL
ncbi:MAG: hypothetical protein H7832_07315, partial [Magnetococcus sp. DMHC-6]